MADLLLERYGWTLEYVESLDFEAFDKLVKLVSKKRFESLENDRKNEQATLLVSAKAVFFGLQASSDLPPSKAEAKRKKPDWPKIEKARRQMMNFMEDWQKALSHPWYFAKHMGLVPAFDKPEEEVKAVRLRTRKDVESMQERMLNQLIALRDKHGPDADLRTLGQEPQGEQYDEDGPVVEPATQADLNRELNR